MTELLVDDQRQEAAAELALVLAQCFGADEQAKILRGVEIMGEWLARTASPDLAISAAGLVKTGMQAGERAVAGKLSTSELKQEQYGAIARSLLDEMLVPDIYTLTTVSFRRGFQRALWSLPGKDSAKPVRRSGHLRAV